ncbi:MAG: UxaA family hydrolase [Synergistaceae bacterium]|nr:UxaA family hydrolase [Synergistaceae bacterium]
METENYFSDMTRGSSALVLHERDNVGVALSDLKAGDSVTVIEGGGAKYDFTVSEDIAFGHKFALRALPPESRVYKYGEEIGRMSSGVDAGGWIHVHNMYCDRGMK